MTLGLGWTESWGTGKGRFPARQSPKRERGGVGWGRQTGSCQIDAGGVGACAERAWGGRGSETDAPLLALRVLKGLGLPGRLSG